MSQMQEDVAAGERHIYCETQDNEGEITITPTSLKINQSGEITENKRMRMSPYKRLGPPPLKDTIRHREDLRARLGKKMVDSGRRDVPQKVNSNKADSKTQGATGRRGTIVGKVARRIVTESKDSDDVNVETLTAGQVKEIYMNRYPEAGKEIYDTLITKSTPPGDDQHIEMSLQMMKQRDESKDPVLRENLLILSAYHLKVYHNLRHGRR